MTTLHPLLLLALLSVASSAAAATPPSDAPLRIAQSDEDEDEDAPTGATPTPKAVEPSAPVKTDAPAAPATAAPAPAPAAAAKPEAAKPAATAAPAVVPAEQLQLVSGAPLNNPNVGVHIVEQKAYSDSGRREVVLYPVAMQVNGKFTQHYGTMGSFVYHLQENFGLQISGGYNWYNSESGFNGELVEKFRSEAQAATSLLWTWGILGGVEVTPIYGKFALFEGTLAHFAVVINGGAGIGGTRHQLKAETVNSAGVVSPATYGDTGLRFMGSLGAGFRLQLGKRIAVRLELRDVVYTARMERVNGCDVTDLRAMNSATDLSRVQVSPSCQVSTFQDGSLKRSIDISIARKLVETPSSDVLNNVGMYFGASFLF
ncbi:MAG: outer membrane beta-barrel domain-containing protein [Archangium sp.]|nr:outer membrane beta-barrel domain-containing protein [Archangium sp.]